MVPLGVWIEMGWMAMRQLMTGASIVQKWAVQPVSAMAWAPGSAIVAAGEETGAGGPIGVSDGGSTTCGTCGASEAGGEGKRQVAGVIVLVGVEGGRELSGSIGFPRRQTAEAEGGVALVPPREERPLRPLLPPLRIVLLPPIM